ncbi:MAG TPA: alcohol dehydrogenase catalytic domain-containing protein [Candidatus Methylomirabilis sp.]|jgi:L-iditol 2-dehydrogenase|nr:alcohol dehydrogenase catalytic domain-containing protein [Candidatus Methylomirabilis sp.]
MKAIVFYRPGDIRFEEVATPTPGPGEVVVRIGSALTCGTDLKTYRRGHPVMMKKTPALFGHEWAGTVEAVGEGVDHVRVGDRVVAANSAPCHRCFTCRMGRVNLCEHLEFLNGAYAEYIRVPARIVQQNLLPLPGQLGFAEAALVEPLACALLGIERSGVRLGQTLCLFGAGPMGLLLTQLAKRQGVTVIMVGKGRYRLDKAAEAGADEVLDAAQGDGVLAEVLRLSPEGRGADVTIEATGRPEVWEHAVEVTRKAGSVVLFGGCEPGTSFRVDTRRMHYEELTLLGAFHHTPRHIREALTLLAQGGINADLLLTHRMALRSLPEAFDLLQRGEAIKVALKP